jgi:GAF domain-containing protein
MPAVRRLADFLLDLQQLERNAARGDGILEAFVRHTPFAGGALYLRDRDANLRLAAKSQQFVAPEILADDPPTELIASGDRVLVPLRSGREHLGLLALSGGDYSDDDLDLLRAAAAYVGTLCDNQRLAQEMR